MIDMPRISERSQALQDIDAALETAAYEYVLSPLTDENTAIKGYIQDLLLMHDTISSTRYLFKGPKSSAGRYAGDSLEGYIYEYPDMSFLHLFRMHRESFIFILEPPTIPPSSLHICYLVGNFSNCNINHSEITAPSHPYAM